MLTYLSGGYTAARYCYLQVGLMHIKACAQTYTCVHHFMHAYIRCKMLARMSVV